MSNEKIVLGDQKSTTRDCTDKDENDQKKDANNKKSTILFQIA